MMRRRALWGDNLTHVNVMSLGGRTARLAAESGKFGCLGRSPLRINYGLQCEQKCILYVYLNVFYGD